LPPAAREGSTQWRIASKRYPASPPLARRRAMDVMFTHCAGLDVHKKTVTACRVTPDPTGLEADGIVELRVFGTMTADLLALSDWLAEAGITHVAMESTGEYWRPVYNLLEGDITIFLVNAAHVK
jgi:transposase